MPSFRVSLRKQGRPQGAPLQQAADATLEEEGNLTDGDFIS